MSALRRNIGVVECTLMGVGVMLGAGIYALVGQAAALAGNAVWASFLIASIVAGFTGLSYAELSSFIPKAGGEYYYARRAFGHLTAFLTSWLLLLGVIVCSATVALGFAGYLNAMTGAPEIPTACGVALAAAALLVWGTKQSAWVAAFCTVVELLGLIIIIYVGTPKLGSMDYLETSSSGPLGVLTAAALIFFAYVGFEEIVQLAEETRDAPKNIPRALLLSIVLTTLLYVAVALCAISVLGWERLGSSKAPLAEVASVALGDKGFLALSLIALFSTANTVLILMMSASRLLYGMAEDGSLPPVLARLHRQRDTPYVATLVVAGLAVAMIVALRNITVVASVTNFAVLATFVVINAAVVVLRYREPDTKRPFRIPGNVGKLPLAPLLGAAASLALLSFVGIKAIGVGTALALAGLLLYRGPRQITVGESRTCFPLEQPSEHKEFTSILPVPR